MALTKGLTSGDSMFNSVADLQASKSRIKTIVSTNDGTNIQFYTVSASDLGSGVPLASGLFANPIGVASVSLNIATPVNALPVNAATDVSTTPTLTASAFSGTDIHIHSIWSVYSDSGGTVQVYSSGASNDLVSHTVPASSNLADGTELFFDVQYVGVEAISAKSTLTSFTTELAFNKLFAITLTSGTSAELTVISGLDFAGSGGLDWTKKRTGIESHALCDTERLATKLINSDTVVAETTVAQSLKTFNSDGFTLGTDQIVNATGDDYVHWQWLKSAGRFDVLLVTKISTNETFSHSIDILPGLMIFKDTDNAQAWRIWHKDLTNTTGRFLEFDTGAENVSDDSTVWNSTAPTANQFTLGSFFNNADISCLIFAHNPTKGVFCGSYTGDGGASNKVVIGFQLGWIMIKSTTLATENWVIFDSVRGINAGTEPKLAANLSDQEFQAQRLSVDSNSFTLTDSDAEVNGSGQNYIFMAWADPALF